MMRENTDWHEDAGKSRVDLNPVLAMVELGRVMEYGSRKYGEHNWSKHADRWAWTQLIASALRHLFAWMAREDNDPESGLNHLAHALANIAMLLDLVLMSKGEDDRNPAYIQEEPDPWREFDEQFLTYLKETEAYRSKYEMEDLHDAEGWHNSTATTGREVPDSGVLRGSSQYEFSQAVVQGE
jgi:hypothetical protein